MSDLNVWKANPNLDTYLYTQPSQFRVRVQGFFGVAVTLSVLIGMIFFFNLSIWYWIVFAPIGITFIISRLLRYYVQIHYKKFDVAKHKKFVKSFWESNTEPTVDVFLPWCGEEYSVYEEVLKGCTYLDYTNYKVCILDDKGDSYLEVLAQKYGYNYLSRPNKGEYRKAGNLRYGYENSDGEFVLVLDADFVPASNFLREALPYIVTNKEAGIIQTPQFFESSKRVRQRSHVEYGAGTITEDFYRLDLPSRDVFKAAICVGTSAIYRRKAILEAGGPPKVWGTEDVRQGLLITRIGYYVRYLPLILSIGLAPDTLQAYFKQHNRWCTGSVMIPFSEYYTKARLYGYAKIAYLSNIFYYLAEGLIFFYSLHLLLLLAFHHDNLLNMNLLLFLPFFIFEQIYLPITRVTQIRYQNIIAGASNAFTYIYTLPRVFRSVVLPWEAAGAKSQSVSSAFEDSVFLSTVLYVVYVVLFILIISVNKNAVLTESSIVIIIWTFVMITTKGYYLVLANSEIYAIKVRNTASVFWTKIKQILSTRNFYQTASVVFVAATSVGTYIGYQINGIHEPGWNTEIEQFALALVDKQAYQSQFNRSTESEVVTSTLARAPEVSGSNNSQQESEEVKGITYTFVAQSNDFYHKLARKAVQQYIEQNKMKRDVPAMVRAETMLVYGIGAQNKSLNTGDVVEFDSKFVDEVIRDSFAMSNIERDAWSQYQLN